MKKNLLTIVFLFITLFSINSIKSAYAEAYNIEIEEKYNIAEWKYDWDIVNIGSANTNFDSGHLRMENINTSTSNYALYETNKFNEFRLDMYANLNLPSPSDFGIEGNDWANLYLTFFIDYEDAKTVDNVAQAACPWTLNKGWMSIAFERIAGGSHIQLLVNEAFDGAGANRFYLNGDSPGEGSCLSSIDWCDNNYHWFTITAESTRSLNPDKPRPKEEGITLTVYIDGVKQTSYFQSNAYYSNTNLREEIVDFSHQKGYLGFWASSSFGASYNTQNTGVAVDIQKLQITSYDGIEKEERANAKPFERCAKPSFNLDPILNYSPQASYEVDEEFELKLSELFSYDGDKSLTYTATYNGSPIGTIRNGYFIWAPDTQGTYTIKFTCTDGELSAINDVRFRVKDSMIDDPIINTTNSQTKTDDGENNNNQSKSGCKSSMITSLSVLSLSLAVSICALKAKKENE